MKKLIAILLSLVTIFSLAACGSAETHEIEDTKPSVDVPVVTEPSATEDSEPTAPSATEPTISDDIGWKTYYFPNVNGRVKALIRFPVTVPENLDMLLIRTDLFFVDGYEEGESPEVNSVAEVFPAYFDQTNGLFEYEHGLRYSNGTFTLESAESVGVINGYEMYKFVGYHNFTWRRKTEITRKFVAYATQLKGNGAYIYWFGEDKTDDQSMFETLEEYAYNMALTLNEAEY